MEGNSLLFRGGCYKQLEAASIVNPFPRPTKHLHGKTENKGSFSWSDAIFLRQDREYGLVRREEVEYTFNFLNRLHQSMESTFELENEGELPILDLLMEWQWKTLELDIYRGDIEPRSLVVHPQNTSLESEIN